MGNAGFLMTSTMFDVMNGHCVPKEIKFFLFTSSLEFLSFLFQFLHCRYPWVWKLLLFFKKWKGIVLQVCMKDTGPGVGHNCVTSLSKVNLWNALEIQHRNSVKWISARGQKEKSKLFFPKSDRSY